MPGRKKRQQGRRSPSYVLTAEVGDKPEEKGENYAEEKASNDGEVKRGVLAAVNDVAGKLSQTEGKLASEVEKGAEENKHCAEEKKRAAEIAKGLHGLILPEAGNKSFPKRFFCSLLAVLDIYVVSCIRYL